MSEHSLLPPSSAARRVACAASWSLERMYPETESHPSAAEGNLAHELAARMLRLNDEVDHMSIAHNHTDDMVRGAKLYRDTIRNTQIKLFGTYAPELLHIEESVDIKVIHSESWGTPDCWMSAPGELYIWDYKFGHGYIDVYENWQLIAYAAGILATFSSGNDTPVRVIFTIVQPRCFTADNPVRSWHTTRDLLLPYFLRLREAEHAALAPNPLATPSPQCKYCKARHACKALQRAALESIDVATSDSLHELTPEHVGAELRIMQHAANTLRNRITGLEQQALHSIKRGSRIPGYTIEQSQGRERWKVSPGEVETLGKMCGVPLAKSIDVITPKQAVAAGLPRDLVSAYSETPQGEIKLVQENLRGVFK